jgi:uncharacterized protein YlzI (FlbEa/FlbD family)
MKEITDINGVVFYVAISSITTLERLDENTTAIHLIGGEIIIVAGTIDNVKALLGL